MHTHLYRLKELVYISLDMYSDHPTVAICQPSDQLVLRVRGQARVKYPLYIGGRLEMLSNCCGNTLVFIHSNMESL